MDARGEMGRLGLHATWSADGRQVRLHVEIAGTAV